MALRLLGESPIDIHTGGVDLVFPHHENEMTQSRAAGHPFARFWVHNGMVDLGAEKMSKSLGNYFTVHEILEKHDAAALRQWFLGSQYRSPMDFSEEGLEEAGRATDRIYDTLDRVNHTIKSETEVAPDAALVDAFRQEMDDDFNTPRALALIYDEVRALNRSLDDKKVAGVGSRAAALRTMCDTLGLLHEGYFDRKKERWLRRAIISREAIESRIAERDEARKTRNWEKADRIREQLQNDGIVIEDTPGGTLWKVK
jgi:cysteinyl-tRNA synthetase